MLLLKLDLIWQLEGYVNTNKSSILGFEFTFGPSWAIHLPWDKSDQIEFQFILASKLSQFGPEGGFKTLMADTQNAFIVVSTI